MQEESRTGSALLGLIAVSIVAVACATATTPAGELAGGSSPSRAAVPAEAAPFAPRNAGSTDAGHDVVRRADLAGRNDHARRLAEQAEVDAQLARTIAAAERSRRAVLEVEATLRDEIERLDSATARAFQ